MNESIPRHCLAALQDLNASGVEFFERDLLDHLKGTFAVLRQWKASHDLALAGLFHAVYLTDFFTSHDPNPSNRKRIRDVIGDSAERIVYNYCVMDRRAFVVEAAIMEPGFADNYTNSDVRISSKEDCQLVELIWANSIEQVQRHCSPAAALKPLVPLFRASRHRVGEAAVAEYERLLQG